jgi:hypothetical protein
VESGVRAVPVVAMEPGLKVGGAMDGVGVDGGIAHLRQCFEPAAFRTASNLFRRCSPPSEVVHDAENSAVQIRFGPRLPYEISSFTSAFSSFSSATEASILERLKSLIGTSCTIFHWPPSARIGNELIRSLSTS